MILQGLEMLPQLFSPQCTHLLTLIWLQSETSVDLVHCHVYLHGSDQLVPVTKTVWDPSV